MVGGTSEYHHLKDKVKYLGEGVLWLVAIESSPGFEHYFAFLFVVLDPQRQLKDPMK